MNKKQRRKLIQKIQFYDTFLILAVSFGFVGWVIYKIIVA